MHRVKNTFPFPLPLSIGDVIDISELPEREMLVANGYVEEIEPEADEKHQLIIIDEASVVPNDTWEKLDNLQIGIDAGAPGGDKTEVVVAKPKKTTAKKSKVETK